MCGIAGLINFNNIDNNSILESLRHRGPDAKSNYDYKNLSLFHTRLAIQDHRNGCQPFIINHHVIIFNGEIYNHLDLRRFVKSYSFKTKSDTETILALYIELGDKCFDLVDGMFALCILNKKNDSIVLARDRVGKKPIYLLKNNNQIFFSSELNSLKILHRNIKINYEAIYTYLRCGFFPDNLTAYENVIDLLPGYVYSFNLQDLKIKKKQFFSIEKQYLSTDSRFQFDIDELDQIIQKSVQNRLISSDFEVGLFLSGGIDSSIILEHASRVSQNLKTYTVKFDSESDESEVASRLSDIYSTNHTTIEIDKNIHKHVEKILSLYGEPFMDSSAIPSYFISQEASKHVKVALNGDGADELFAGYRRYVPIAMNIELITKRLSLLNKLLPYPKSKSSNYNYFHRLLNISSKENLDYYLSSTNDIFEDVYAFSKNQYLSNLDQEIKRINELNIHNLSKAMILDTKLLLANDLLKKMDIATMANSLEVRSPFLSKYLLEYAPCIPIGLKINSTRTKYALRLLAKKYNLFNWNLSKKGFEVPLSSWVNNELRDNIHDRLEANSFSSNFVDKKFIYETLNKKNVISGEKRSKVLWTLYSLEIWHSSLPHNKTNTQQIESITIRKKKVILVTTGLGLGGAERIVYEIAKNIDKERFELNIVSLSSQIDTLSRFKELNIPIHVLNYKKNLKSFFKSIYKIKKLLEDNNTKLLHAHMFHALVVCSMVKIIHPKIKVIFTAHNTFQKMYIRRFILFLLKPLRAVDTIFPGNKRRFFNKKESSIIPNGINFQDYKPIQEIDKYPRFTFVVIGRLEKIKNHIQLIYIAKKLVDYDFEIKFVGSGSLENYLKNKVNELKLQDKVTFLGPLNNAADILAKSHCLLISSLWEASPIVAFESVASEVPLISTPVGNMESIFGKFGVIKNIDDFHDSMIEMIENYPKYSLKIRNKREILAQKYDFKKIISLYESLYSAYE